MVLPEQPVTLTAEQIAALNRELGNMRHDINNNLSLVLAAVEMIRAKPHMTDRMITTLMIRIGEVANRVSDGAISREWPTQPVRPVGC